MVKTLHQSEVIKRRLIEIHVSLRVVEPKTDLAAWKKLFAEQLHLERELRGSRA